MRNGWNGNTHSSSRATVKGNPLRYLEGFMAGSLDPPAAGLGMTSNGWRATRPRISNYCCDETSFTFRRRDLDWIAYFGMRHPRDHDWSSAPADQPGRGSHL